MTLCIPGIERVSGSYFDRQFCFDVAGQKHFCSVAAAVVLSSRAAELLEKDPEARGIKIDFVDRYHMFDVIMHLLCGGSVDLSDPTLVLSDLLRLIDALGNDDLQKQVIEMNWSRMEIKADTVLSRIKQKQENDLDLTQELEFVAAHSKDVIVGPWKSGVNAFEEMGLDASAIVLKKQTFDWCDPDAVASAILARPSLFPLLEVYPFDKASPATMESFMDKVEPSMVTDGIWKALCARLVRPVGASQPAPAEPKMKEREITYTGSQYEGIISVLTRELGGNLHDLGAVTVTSKDLYGGGYLPKFVLDLKDLSSCYESADRPHPWFSLDFGERRVKVKHYWVRTYGNGPGHLKSWSLEGSSDGENWQEIDRVHRARKMNRDNAVKQRDVDNVLDEPVRFIRFSLTGKNHGGYWILNCSGLELFGTLYDPKV